MTKLLNLVISGAVAGAIYSIMASGLVLTFQTSGIFNFAHGAVAFVTAYLYFQLHQPEAAGGLGVPIVPAAVLSVLVFAPLLGLALDRILLRRLAEAPVYARIVGTIGLLVALPALALLLVETIGNTVLELGLPVNAPGFQPPGLGPTPREVVWRPLSGVAIDSDQLGVFLAAAVAATLLWLVLRHTRIGLEMRAEVDRRELAALRGVNPARASAVAWVMTMVLAGLGGVLLAPLFGIGATDFTFVVLGSLAAVVVSGLRSIPLAFGGGLLLGVFQNLVFGYAPDFLADISGFQASIPFILTVVLLFFLGRDRVRAAGTVADEIPPPDHRAGMPAWRRLLPWGVATAALLAYTTWLADDFWAGLIAKGLALGIVFLSFVVVTGLGGTVSLAQATFVTAGAFTVGWAVNHQWPQTAPVLLNNGRLTFPFAALLAIAAAAAIGALIAIPVRRLGALSLALATLAVAFVADLTVFQLDSVRNGSFGWSVRGPVLGPFDFGESRQMVVLLLLVFGLLTVLVRNLRHSAFGRAVLAVRSSEVAARTSGIAPDRAKVLLFAVSGGIAGLGGALFAVVASPVNNTSTPALVGLIWLAVTVTFGVRRPGGALLAGLAFATVSESLRVVAGWWFMPEWADDVASSSYLPAILFGLGAINLAKNPDGVLALAGLRRLERRRARDLRATAPASAPGGQHPEVAAIPVSALALTGVTAGYGDVEVLHGVDLVVPRGTVVALLGANGAGKSTLCAVAAGLLVPRAGRVWRDGADVTGLPSHRRAREGLVFAPEARGIFPGLTVEENLALTLRAPTDREAAYERFPLLAARRRQAAGLLSGGEQQMLTLAPALVRPPPVLIADEPSLGLAPLAVEEVFAALAALRELGSALLLVEEKPRDALDLADTIVLMELGRVTWSGPRAEADADRLAVAYLGVEAAS